MLKKKPVTESSYNPPHLQLKEMLVASAEGRLNDLPLPDLQGSPYDTSTVNSAGYTGRPHPVHDVREAAQPTFTGWEHKAIVRGTFGFVLNPDTSSVNAVADAVRLGAAHLPPQRLLAAGLYAFNSLDKETLDQFSSLGLRRVVADVRLRSQNIGGIASHNGEMLGILAIDRAFAGDASGLDDGEMTFVEGEVQDYTPASRTKGRQRPSITILRPDGFSQPILLGEGEQLTFGSVRRTAVTAVTRETDIHPKYALPGDYVHLMARAAKRRSRADYYLQTLGEESIHLQEGSLDRISTALREQDRLDTLVDILDTIEDLNQRRKLIAQYVIDSMRVEDGRLVGGISMERRRELMTRMGDKLPRKVIPMVEVPVALTMQQETTYEILQAFGKAPLAKNISQFIDFCWEVARGEHVTGNALAYEYILKVSQNVSQTNVALRNKLAEGAVRWFYDNFTQANREAKMSVEQTLAANFVMKSALNELVHLKTEKDIAEPLVRIVLESFGNDPPMPELRMQSATALLQSLIRCGIWTDEENAKHRKLVEDPSGADVVAVRFDGAYRAYRGAMPRTISLLRKAENGGGLRNPQRPSSSPFTVIIRGLEIVSAKFLAIDPDTPDTDPGSENRN